MTKNKICAMVLGEVLFAVVLCGILLGISIFMFKSNDITKSPLIYSILKNLPDVNYVIMEDCYRDGTCQNPAALPDTPYEYCLRLADNFVISGNYDCTTSGSSSLTQVIGNSSYGQNFKLSNGIVFYNLNPGEWDDSLTNNFIDVYFDINGPKRGENKYGYDIFSVRIFKNGEVIPSDDNDFHEDEELFTYRVILNRAVDSENINSRVKEVVDTKKGVAALSSADTDELPFREKVSFKEAVCVSKPATITNYYESEDCSNDYSVVDLCDFTDTDHPYYNDKSAFCAVEPVRPRGTGIFKIFGI